MPQKKRCGNCKTKSKNLHPCANSACLSKEDFCNNCLTIGRCSLCAVSRCCNFHCQKVIVGVERCDGCLLLMCDDCEDDHLDLCKGFQQRFVKWAEDIDIIVMNRLKK